MQTNEQEINHELLISGSAESGHSPEAKSETPAPSSSKTSLNIVEIGLPVIAVGASVAGAALQNLLLTSIAALPLSASVAFNLAQRQKLQQQLQAKIHQHQATLIQVKSEYENQLGNLIASLAQVSDQLQGVQGQVSDLGRGTRDLHDYTRILGTEQKQIEEVVDCLRQIENYTQAIQSDPSHAKAYYNRGLTHQRLGDAEAAVLDYTEAIQVSDTYAKAYHNRGVARAAIGDRKGAVEDLRTAAKHFFEQGDIASYQRARDLAKRVHEVGDPAKDSKEVPLELLFS